MTNWQRAKIDIARLEAANAQLVKQYGELQHKYLIVSTLMRRFARLCILDKWSRRMSDARTGGERPPRLRTREEWDRFNAALIDRPWEVVTDL